jgi:hypothetical protein
MLVPDTVLPLLRSYTLGLAKGRLPVARVLAKREPSLSRPKAIGL